MLPACVFCDQLTGESDEHILLSALGGRKHSKRLLCAGHNNLFGRTIDKALTDGLRPLASLLSIRVARGGAPGLHAVRAADGTGDRFNLLPGGRIVSPTTVELEPIDEKRKRLCVTVDAAKPEQMRAIVAGILAKHGQAANFDATQAHEQFLPAKALDLQCSIGGDDLRCIAKMALLLFASAAGTRAAKGDAFSGVRDFIEHGGDSAGFVRHDYEAMLPEVGAIEEPLAHRIIVSASPTTKCVVAFIVLYGSLRFSVLLAEEWTGGPVTIAYIVDPLTRQQETVRSFAPSPFSERDFRLHECTREMLDEPLRKLFERVDARVRDLTRRRIIQLSMDEAFAGLKEGDLITEEHIGRLSMRVAELYMSLTNRRPLRRPLDAGRILHSNQKPS